MKKLYILIIATGFSGSILGQNIRTLNGSGNNLTHSQWGATNTPFRIIAQLHYADSISQPAGANRPNPRTVSNVLCQQDSFMVNELGLSDFVWAWGQFIDHDMVLTLDANPSEVLPIAVPACDPLFDPTCSGNKIIPFRRAEYVPTSGTSVHNPRLPINRTTAFLDASTIYGTDPFRLAWMRTYSGGKLKTSLENLLPFNTVTGKFGAAIDPNAPPMSLVGASPTAYFVSGDIRANEQPTLTALHVLFVREHNRLCNELQQANPNWDDEQLFQKARKIVGALVQAITYEEFLPTIGISVSPYQQYNPTVNPSIFNSFAAAAFRFGHSAVSGRLMRYDENTDTTSFTALHLRASFTNPLFLREQGGIEPFLRGLAVQKHQKIDAKIISDLRNFLFGNPGSGGMDLAALNIQRGREKGLPDYNTLRQDFNLSPIADFSDITADVVTQQLLLSLYGTVENIDPWIGLICEEHQPNSIFGACMQAILKRQFEVLREGDRFYYENDPSFTPLEIASIKHTTLEDIIRRNTTIQNLQNNVFIAYEPTTVAVEYLPFEKVETLILSAFPNPAQDFFNLKIQAIKGGKGEVLMVDNNGRVVRKEAIFVVEGANVFTFQLDTDWASGLYHLLVRMEGDSGQLKILKTGNF